MTERHLNETNSINYVLTRVALDFYKLTLIERVEWRKDLLEDIVTHLEILESRPPQGSFDNF